MHRMSPYFRIFWFGCFLVCFGCGSDSMTQESSQETFPLVNMTGTWKGTAASAAGGFQNITLVLEQTGSGVSGSYTCADGTAACVRTQGTFSARVVKSSFTGGVVFTDIVPGGPSCSLHGSVSGATLTADSLCNSRSKEEPQEAWELIRQEG